MKFSVRSERFAGGEGIHVDWTDGPPAHRIGTIFAPFESVDRDGYGEILSGGNRYVGYSRTVSPGARRWAEADVAKIRGHAPLEEGRLLERTTFDVGGRPHVGRAG